jgi:deazaflavin-dependent oxidoreductase (nitroreductase family)
MMRISEMTRQPIEGRSVTRSKTESKARNYRRMVNTVNKVITALQRAGIVFGPMRLLTVAGRRSGVPRTFPIAVVPLDGGQYVVQAYPKAAWVANVRAADTVTLARGRRSSTVRLVEVPVEERRALLRELVRTQPTSAAQRLVTTGLADSPTPDGVAAAAERIAVFRVMPLENAS